MRRTQFAVTALVAFAALGFLSPLRLEGQRASRFDRELVNGREVVAGEALVKFRSPLQGPELARVAGDTAADQVRRITMPDKITNDGGGSAATNVTRF